MVSVYIWTAVSVIRQNLVRSNVIENNKLNDIICSVLLELKSI